jgi:hypothetical protein
MADKRRLNDIKANVRRVYFNIVFNCVVQKLVSVLTALTLRVSYIGQVLARWLFLR